MAETFEIPLAQIAVVDRERKDFGNLQELGESLKRRQIHPIAVRRVGEEDRDKYGLDPKTTPWALVAGGRRLAAALTVGMETIRAEDFAELDPIEQKILELEENVKRKQMSWDEEASTRARIHDLLAQLAHAAGKEWTQQDTARYLGESTATVSRDVRLSRELEDDPSLKQASSKKAAIRQVEMREHLQRREANASAPYVRSLRGHMEVADAREWLRKLSTGSVDLLFSDVPYGGDFFDLAIKDRDARKGVSEYDDSEQPIRDILADVIPQMIRVTKPTGWLCLMISDGGYQWLRRYVEHCCTTHFAYADFRFDSEGDIIPPKKCNHPQAGKGCDFLRAEEPRWIWHRPNSQNPSRFPELHAQNQYECFLVVNRGEAKLLKPGCPNVLTFDNEYGDRIHMMQKPVALCEEIVSRLSLRTELVVDPFFGSGALLKAATRLGRRIAGCELNANLAELGIAYVSEDYGGDIPVQEDNDLAEEEEAEA